MNTAQKKTVLVIEDDQEIKLTLASILQTEGYATRTAENGLEALRDIDQQGLPSLMLLDMRMPVMDGWEFAAQFSNKYNRKVPIIVMTAAADAGRRAKEIHANDFVGKPFNLDELLEKIATHI